MARPRFGAESSVKLFGALSARARRMDRRDVLKSPARVGPPINTRVKETVKISTCPASRAARRVATSQEALDFPHPPTYSSPETNLRQII